MPVYWIVLKALNLSFQFFVLMFYVSQLVLQALDLLVELAAQYGSHEVSEELWASYVLASLCERSFQGVAELLTQTLNQDLHW